MEISKAELQSAAVAAEKNSTAIEINGSDILVKALQAENVKYVWGYPGGAVLHIYDALYKQETIQHVLVRHEQAAVHAADGYARATGDVGVALVTSGPGVTNAVTGIATAYMDSIPMVIITGQVPTHAIGLDAFQECDTVGITRPIVKHNFLVEDVKDLATTLKKAFYIATTGRPGPVVVDIPKDITNPIVTFPYNYPDKVKISSYTPVLKVNSGQIKKAVALLLSAKRPVIYSGGGVVQGEASAQLVQLARLLNFPVTSTLMGLGAYPATDKQFLGMLGMHGTVEANTAMHHADVILCAGARFDDRVTNTTSKFCPNAKLIHIDVDPTSISKTIAADIPIVGPVDSVLDEMLELVLQTDERPEVSTLENWWEEINQWRSRYSIIDKPNYDTNSDMLKPQEVVRALWEVTGGDAYVCSDVGQHQMFSAQYYQFDKPRRWINSGGLGTMGFGLPAAIGVQLAHPKETVVCVTGEGSIQMCIQELSTCTQYNLPVKIICLNNQALGMVKQWQDMQYSSRYSESLYEDSLPDFPKLMEAYGHVGIKVTKRSELKQKLEECFAMKDRCVFMDIYVDPLEHVYPMQVAPNGSMRDMLISKTEPT